MARKKAVAEATSPEEKADATTTETFVTKTAEVNQDSSSDAVPSSEGNAPVENQDETDTTTKTETAETPAETAQENLEEIEGKSETENAENAETVEEKVGTPNADSPEEKADATTTETVEDESAGEAAPAENLGDAPGNTAAASLEANAAPKIPNYIVSFSFQDAPQYRTLGQSIRKYEIGDDVSHFAVSRLTDLVNRKFVEKVNPE